MSTNPDLQTTLDDAVSQVLGILTGLDLHYVQQLDRYRAITHALNRALRANALEHEWSYYSSLENVGVAQEGLQTISLRPTVRPRIINDDAVQLQDEHGHTAVWAYWLPRDALHKYPMRGGLWAAHTRNLLTFSRPLTRGEQGLQIMVPVMREPRIFVVPGQAESIESLDPDALPGNGDMTADEIREQLLDFWYPEVVIMRAAYMYAQTDPVMQPRAQTLEAAYKDLMYQIIERDDRNTDSPFLNEFFVPVQNGIVGQGFGHHWHPHSDERR
jgi:hypothetical protein